MAQTAYSTVGNQTPTLWSDRLLSQAQNKTFWRKYEGPEGSGMPIIRKDDLTKTSGDTIKMDMVLALTGAGVTGDTTALVGNEEALKFRQNSVAVTHRAHAVRWTELVEQVINYDMRSTALNQLAKWLAEQFDNDAWSELTGGGTTIPTPNKWYAGAATGTASLTTSTTPTLGDISDLKATAQATLKIEPMMTEDGNEYFGLVLDPFCALALKKDSSYQTAQREAQIRGDSNPLFTGAIGVWDGVIIYSNNNVPSLGTGGSGGDVRYGKNVFFGGQALARGFAQYPSWREEAFDYGLNAGVATTYLKGDRIFLYDLSAAGDASGNQALGHMVYYAAGAAPVA